MGAQSCCTMADENELTTTELFFAVNSDQCKKFNRDDLRGGVIKIGEKGYDAPLARKAMLQETYFVCSNTDAYTSS